MKKSILIIASLVTGLFLASCSEAAETAANHAEDAKEMVKDEVVDAVEKKMDEMKVKTIKLEQTEGAFTTESLELEAGQEYDFEITNHAGRDAAILVVPADKATEGATVEELMAASIPAAQLAGALKDGESGTAKGIKLEAGEYVYFCPMNQTPQYKLSVK